MQSFQACFAVFVVTSAASIFIVPALMKRFPTFFGVTGSIAAPALTVAQQIEAAIEAQAQAAYDSAKAAALAKLQASVPSVTAPTATPGA